MCVTPHSTPSVSLTLSRLSAPVQVTSSDWILADFVCSWRIKENKHDYTQEPHQSIIQTLFIERLSNNSKVTKQGNFKDLRD